MNADADSVEKDEVILTISELEKERHTLTYQVQLLRDMLDDAEQETADRGKSLQTSPTISVFVLFCWWAELLAGSRFDGGLRRSWRLMDKRGAWRMLLRRKYSMCLA